MRASHVALLSLAASTAAPVFAAPLSHLKARSKDGGAGLSARDSHDGRSERHVPPSHNDTPERYAARKAVNDFISTVANVKARGSNVQQEARSSSDNAIEVVERDELGPGKFIQARGLSERSDLGLNILGRLLRRDVTPENLLTRDSPGDVNQLITLMNALAPYSRRDIASDELGARSELEDFLNTLNSRRNTGDDIANAYMSKHSARDPSAEQETQARSDDGTTEFIKALLNSRDVSSAQQETQARSDDPTTAFMKALLQSRDESSGFTTDDMLRMLASRGLDVLD